LFKKKQFCLVCTVFNWDLQHSYSFFIRNELVKYKSGLETAEDGSIPDPGELGSIPDPGEGGSIPDPGEVSSIPDSGNCDWESEQGGC
jgi:hypothetical protein